MSENRSNKTEKKRSGSPPPLSIATIRATGAETVALDDTVVTAKRRMLLAEGPTTRTAAITTTTTTTWEIITPIPILILILKYLDQPGLMKASTVSKQWHRIIHTNPGMEQHRIIPMLKISASPNTGDKGRTLRLVESLVANLHKLQRYRVLQLLDVNKFDDADMDEGFQRFPWRFDRIVSFDLSSPSQVSSVKCGFLNRLSFRLPNLREINLSNIGGEGFDGVLTNFSINCPRLERITWNNINTVCDIYLSGCEMSEATNLREIMMDGSVFTSGGSRVRSIDTISDLESHPRFFLFCRLESQVVERITIRHAKYRVGLRKVTKVIPQNALIKYIRNAPRSLRWFRSDLFKENIEMLRVERPGIEFLN